MEHLPINLDVKNRKIIVVGGGTTAARKAEIALRAGAIVSSFAPELNDDFLDIRHHKNFSHINRPFTKEDVRSSMIVYAACETADMNNKLVEMAKDSGTLINIIDNPAACDFIMPAIVDRDPIIVTVSSSGASPVLARIIKSHLESSIPATFGHLAKLIGKYRDTVKAKISTVRDRRHFWEKVIDGTVADLLHAGNEKEAHKRLQEELEQASSDTGKPPMGEVYLVGGGPGDPDLLTFRALRLIQRADVVLYDRLISRGLLNLVRRDAKRIYVGKLPDKHAMQQEEISQLLADEAKKGRRVLRLKGGDPFIFGRGGEEIMTLVEQGVPFQVVPGVTAASGSATYAGIPLTHRDHAQACIFVTGHGKDGQIAMDWNALIQPRQTIAIYMGRTALPSLMKEFIKQGADKTLPVAVIDNGTRQNQRVVTGTLETIATIADEAKLKGPSMIIIGTVVSLREKLNWFKPDGNVEDDDDRPDALARPGL